MPRKRLEQPGIPVGKKILIEGWQKISSTNGISHYFVYYKFDFCIEIID
jgi:hypothetical protein